jgi:hypothetical protein
LPGEAGGISQCRRRRHAARDGDGRGACVGNGGHHSDSPC